VTLPAPFRAGRVADLQTEEGRRHHFTINCSDKVTEFQNQLRKAMTSKMRKRLKGGLAYWELPHVRDLPFVLAVQSFYAETSTAFTDAVAASYLLGKEPGDDGLFDDPELAPLTRRAEAHALTVFSVT
jgi:hypothetical protein